MCSLFTFYLHQNSAEGKKIGKYPLKIEDISRSKILKQGYRIKIKYGNNMVHLKITFSMPKYIRNLKVLCTDAHKIKPTLQQQLHSISWHTASVSAVTRNRIKLLCMCMRKPVSLTGTSIIFQIRTV